MYSRKVGFRASSRLPCDGAPVTGVASRQAAATGLRSSRSIQSARWMCPVPARSRI
ncbi:hypothetical protein [Lysobacter gummosus]|uniref:hypothetical protein n=1 Tax=Lysobacter gummosus TaxID=262324 RepID=UPI00362BA718